MSSSLSTSIANSSKHWKYDVFLNFRGGDVRDKFLSHLREALDRANIKTFVDENLTRGEEISALLQAIEESHVAVTIFSKDYASSSWCLEELVKIIECRHYRGQIVIPVFYDVSSSDVLEQSGIYAEAFAKHEKDQDNAKNVPKWKAAMTKAANLSGRSAGNSRPEAKLVNEIVSDILTSLGRAPDENDLFATDSTVKELHAVENALKLLLGSDSEDSDAEDSDAASSYGPSQWTLGSTGLGNYNPAVGLGTMCSTGLGNYNPPYEPGIMGSTGLGNFNPAYGPGTLGSNRMGNYNPAYEPGIMGSTGLGNYNEPGIMGSTGLGNYNPTYGLGTIGSSGPEYGHGSWGSSGLGNSNASSSYRPPYGLGSLYSTGQSARTSIHIGSPFTYCGCDMCRMSYR